MKPRASSTQSVPVLEEPAAEGMALLQPKPNESSDLWLLEKNNCHPRKTSHAIDDIYLWLRLTGSVCSIVIIE